MSGVLVRAAGLTAVYLLVLSSLAPGDVLLGGLLGLAMAAAVSHRRSPRADSPAAVRLAAAARLLAETAAEVVRGSVRVVRFCLGSPASPGLVELPRGSRSRVNVALWGVLTGEAPDEVVVDVDEGRQVLIIHVVDAGYAEEIRRRHQDAYARNQRKVVS